MPALTDIGHFFDLSAIADAGDYLETRQQQLEQLAQARYMKRGFERCRALRFASEQLQFWFDGSREEKARQEAMLATQIQLTRPCYRKHAGLRFQLALREIRRLNAVVVGTLDWQNLVRGSRHQRTLPVAGLRL